MGISHYSFTPIQYTVLIDSEFGDIERLNDATKRKAVIFIVVSGYLLGSLTLWSNSWVGGIYIIYICATTLVRQLPDRLLHPCKTTGSGRRRLSLLFVTEQQTCTELLLQGFAYIAILQNSFVVVLVYFILLHMCEPHNSSPCPFAHR